MIYLIGGPPKCGKTTLAKQLSKKLNIPFISTDSLELIGMEYTWLHAPKKFDGNYPHTASKGKTNDETYTKNTPKQIAKNYIQQAKSTHLAIDTFSICEITDQNDYIIEGYHLTPQFAAKLSKKYGQDNFKIIFLLKTDQSAFLENIQKSSTPNDWIIAKTKSPETFPKIAEMITTMAQTYKKQAIKYNLEYFEMDSDFNQKIDQIIEILV